MNTNLELNEKLVRFHNLLCWQQKTRRHSSTDPDQTLGRVLALLKLQPEITTNELAGLLDLRPTVLKKALSALEDQGCVEFEYLEHDGDVLVRLTETGREMQPEDVHPDEDAAGLTPEEMDTLDGLLDRAITALEEKAAAERESAGGNGWARHHGAFPGHSHSWMARSHSCGWPL